jgi:hypothetical protein
VRAQVWLSLSHSSFFPRGLRSRASRLDFVFLQLPPDRFFACRLIFTVLSFVARSDPRAQLPGSICSRVLCTSLVAFSDSCWECTAVSILRARANRPFSSFAAQAPDRSVFALPVRDFHLLLGIFASTPRATSSLILVSRWLDSLEQDFCPPVLTSVPCFDFIA